VVGGAAGARFPRGSRPAETRRGGSFVLEGVRMEVRLPGLHNACNALLAARMCRRLGVGLREVREGLRSFRGIARRLEHVGRARGVDVVDDYAHNPAKIRAAWAAVARRRRRVLGVWRPHGYGPLRNMMDALADAFAGAMRPGDRLFLLPVYDAGGTADRSVRSGHLAALLRGRGVAVEEARGLAALARRLAGEAKRGDAVLIMGARDPHLPRLARRVLAALRRATVRDRSARRGPAPRRGSRRSLRGTS
jgi:UDP-N-acetylmuramate--alanine ligase